MGWCPLPFDLEGVFLCVCSWVVGKVSLTLRRRNMQSFISYLGRTELPLNPAILEHPSTEDKVQLLSLGPIYLLPQVDL